MSSYFFIGAMKSATMNTPKIIISTNAGPTQKGESTSHQDQSMLSVNFKPMNRSPRSDKKDTPDFA